MKLFLRMMALVVLMLVALLTFARREYSGAWIAFTNDRDARSGIFLMTGDGEEVRRVTSEDMCGDSASWSPNGRWIAFIEPCVNTTSLMRVRPNGMSLQFVTYASHYEWSPDEQHFLVTRGLTPIYVVEADGNNERILTYEHTNPQWAMDGEWIYAHTLENSQSSLDRIHITTNRSEELFRHRGNYSLPMSLSPDGTHLVTRIPTYHGDELYLMTADGSEAHQIPVDLPPPTLDNIRWSPDSTWIAFSGLDVSAMHIYRIRPDGSDLEHLSDAIEGPFDLHWSPNGEWLLLGIGSYRDSTIARLRADGTSMEILGPGFSPQYAPVSGLEWHPFWLMTVVALMFLASFMIRFRS